MSVDFVFNYEVTHVIHSTDKISNRTLSYMKAILMGIWIVSIECKINDYFCKYARRIDFEQQKG